MKVKGAALKISFVVITYNQKKFIMECLESIQNQTIPIDELIIADDCSTDGTQNVIKHFIKHQNSNIKKIIFFSRIKNIGIVGNLNGAIKRATGDVILITAGDDFSAKSRAKYTLNFFLNNSKAEIFYSSYRLISEEGRNIGIVKRSACLREPEYLIRKGSGIPPQGIAFRNSFYKKIGCVDSRLANEDDFLSMAGVLSGGAWISDKILYTYRLHSNSISAWSLNEKSPNKYLLKFFLDQKNRTFNYIAWKKLIESSNAKNKFFLVSLINKRINISRKYEELSKLNFLIRLKILYSNIRVCTISDYILLLFGYKGALIIKYLRQIKLSLIVKKH
jgi:glycosyltransferase involved in cell wall biosynthesis